VSVFYRDGDTVLYTYSGYLHVTELICGNDQRLDLTPLGRQVEEVGVAASRQVHRRLVRTAARRRRDASSRPVDDLPNFDS
jgi:predicted dithiol-disulfide oxidoreductase (DUF899 family)